MTSDTGEIVQVKNVVFRYFKDGKRNILDNVDFQIKKNSITVLTGKSGCGKSTLANLIAGLYPANGGFLESGEIFIDGENVQKLKIYERAKLVSMMFQNPDLQFCMNTLRKEMQFCLENLCIEPSIIEEKINFFTEFLGISPLLDRKFTELSGGEKQKCALACLFAMESKVLILDEAFANIDEDSVAEIMPMIKKIKENNRTIIAIDHKIELWTEVADFVLKIGECGKVEKSYNSVEKVLKDSQNLLQEKNHKKTLENFESAITLQNFSLKTRIEEKILLENTNIKFPRGKMTAVLGKSGSGKTTTFLSILKQHPYEGDIIIEEKNLKKIRKKDLYKTVGIVFQNPGNQFISQNVLSEIVSSLKVWDKKSSDKELNEKALKMLEEFELSHLKKYSPYMLSQGQQRRLAVLSVLSGNQQILFLDEPTYGQDTNSTNQIMQLLSKKVENENLTVIFITHDKKLANSWADKIFAIENEKFVEVKN